MGVMFLIFLVCSRKFSGASSLYLGTKIVEMGGPELDFALLFCLLLREEGAASELVCIDLISIFMLPFIAELSLLFSLFLLLCEKLLENGATHDAGTLITSEVAVGMVDACQNRVCVD